MPSLLCRGLYLPSLTSHSYSFAEQKRVRQATSATGIDQEGIIEGDKRSNAKSSVQKYKNYKYSIILNASLYSIFVYKIIFRLVQDYIQILYTKCIHDYTMQYKILCSKLNTSSCIQVSIEN